MAKREINVVIAARNAMARGLRSAHKSLQNFGKSAANITKFFAKGFLSAGAAVAAFGTMALRAFAPQEQATRALQSAFAAFGEEVDANVAKVEQFANRMQQETGRSNESLEMRAAQLRQLGVLTDELEDATKATIALERAGMGEAAAIRAVALAREGNFSALQRYIPGLREATTEAEKAEIVNDFLTRKYQEAADQMDTVSGQANLLKENIADLWKEFGRAIGENQLFIDIMQRANQAVADFAARVNEWVSDGGFDRIIQQAKAMGTEITHAFRLAGNSAKIMFRTISGFVDYSSNLIGVMIGGIISNFQNMGNVAIAVFRAIRRPSAQALRDVQTQASHAAAYMAQTYVDLGKAIIDTQRISGPVREALEEREQLHERHAERMLEIAAQGVDGFAAAEKDKTEALKEEERNRVDIARQSARERLSIERDAAIRSAEFGLRAIQDEKDAIEDLAKTRVQQYLDERRAREANRREEEREERRAERIRGRIDRHGEDSVSRRDREFLEAFDQIADAQRRFEDLGRQAILAEEQIAMLKEQLEIEKRMADSLESIEEQNDRLLTVG